MVEDLRGVVTALAVDQHQHRIAAEATQGGGFDRDPGGAGEAGIIGVRRYLRRQGVTQVLLAGTGQVISGDHIDGHKALRNRARLGP
ncbi:hypothetical protein D3C72_1108470 [compost metagenome]